MADNLEPVAAMVSDRARTIRWDQRGAGRSSRHGPFTIAQFIQDLDDVRRATGDDRCVLVGHSWGANLAIHYAQAHPEHVRGIAYVCGTGVEWYPDFSAEHKRTQQRRLGPELGARLAQLRTVDRTEAEEREYSLLYLQSEFSDVARAPALAESVRAVDGRYPVSYEANAALNAETKALDPSSERERCAAIVSPVLVIQGADDPRPLAAADSLVEALPDVERHVIPRSGHFPWLERPEELKALLQHLLDIVASDGPR